MTYKRCKLIIQKKIYVSKEDMFEKLDLFLLGNRISKEQYDELAELLNAQE